MSSIPPPDNCAGYLGARVDPRRIALIRIPHITSFFETAALDTNTTFPDSEAAYISLTMYGATVNIYKHDEPESASLANADFQPDVTGGSTIVVWPRRLPAREREQFFAYARCPRVGAHARRSGWTAHHSELALRIKRANDSYYGGYTPVPGGRTGVPCYFDGAPQGALWSQIENAADPMAYVASFQNLGNAAPQGVHCASVAQVRTARA